MKPKTTKSTESQLDTREFDRGFVVDSFKPPAPQAKARWEKARRKRGRPRPGT